MEQSKVDQFHLIGIELNEPTTNKNGQSNKDCGMLWQKFEQEKVFDQIPDKLTNEVIAVYYEYQGGHEEPFSYFIGCKVPEETVTPDNLKTLTVQGGTYHKVVAKGKIPDCIAEAWKKVWNSDDIERSFKNDFEVYDERCKDWMNAEIDIFLS